MKQLLRLQMLRRMAWRFGASFAGLLIALSIAPFSFAFLAYGFGWGLLLVALIFIVRTPRDRWLSGLAFGLAVIGGRRASREIIFSEVRLNTLEDLSLALLYCCAVAFVYFGCGWLYTRKQLRRVFERPLRAL
jgi:hypothetical protein